MRVIVAQLVVTPNIAENKVKILTALRSAQPGDWIIFPECMLTGYFPEEEWFMKTTTHAEVEAAISEITAAVKLHKCYCLYGAATVKDGRWQNSTIMCEPSGKIQTYHKVGLSELDKRHFKAGTEIPVYNMGGVTFGVQICREVLFPSAWAHLRKQGAQIIFHINNAIKPYDDVWEHVLISRALEDDCFVASVNNADRPQELSSYLISPAGKVLARADKQTEQTLMYEIDLPSLTNSF